MFDRLCLELFGGFHATIRGRPLRLPTRKAEALLAYLALPTGQFRPRDQLTTLLWGDSPEPQARQSLRQALASIRGGWDHPSGPILLVRGDAIALNDKFVHVDVLELERSVAGGKAEAVESALQLIKGRFLEGFPLSEPGFDEWRGMQTARLTELVLNALAELQHNQTQLNLIDAAIRSGMAMLAIDPLHEAAHRSLMRLFLAQGRRGAALRQYQACVSLLERELAVNPEQETAELYRKILRSGAKPGQPLARSSTPTPQQSVATQSHEIPLIGRARELARIRDSLGSVAERGHAIFITGETGIGKSRLIAELARQCQRDGTLFTIGRCYQSERVLPLGPWVNALEATALDPQILAELAPNIVAQLRRLFPKLQGVAEPTTSNEQRNLLFDAIIELVRKLASKKPICIAIEDLHWADETSVYFTSYLSRRIHRLPILMISSFRPEEVRDAPVLVQMLEELKRDGLLDEVVLDPLTRDETGALIHSLIGKKKMASGLEAASDEIWSISRGNPFIVIETVHALGQGAVPDMRLPTKVEDSVTRRLDQLPPPARRLVDVAAVIGRESSFELLRRASRISALEAAAAIDDLVRRRIFDSVGDDLDFRHEWLRRVAISRVLPAVRIATHNAIARSLEYVRRGHHDAVADQIGEHYAHAGEHRRAIPYLVRSGEIALQRYALDDALRVLERAAVSAEHLADLEHDRWRLDIALRQAFILSLQGKQREILTLLQDHAALVRRVNDPGLTSDYCSRLGLLHWYRGEYSQAELVATEALRTAEQAVDSERVGRAEYVLALNSAGIGLPKRGVDHALRAVANLSSTRSRHWAGLAHFALALNRVIAGDLGGALLAADTCTEIGEAEQDSRLTTGGRYIAAWVHVHSGEFDTGVEIAARTLAGARDAVAVCLANGVLGWAELGRGNIASAVSYLRAATDRLRTMPLLLTEARFLSILSNAYLAAEDMASARKTARRVQLLSRADGSRFTRALAERALGRIASASGESARAQRLITTALRNFEVVGAKAEASDTRLCLARVLRDLGLQAESDNEMQKATEWSAAAIAEKRGVEPKFSLMPLAEGP